MPGLLRHVHECRFYTRHPLHNASVLRQSAQSLIVSPRSFRYSHSGSYLLTTTNSQADDLPNLLNAHHVNFASVKNTCDSWGLIRFLSSRNSIAYNRKLSAVSRSPFLVPPTNHSFKCKPMTSSPNQSLKKGLSEALGSFKLDPNSEQPELIQKTLHLARILQQRAHRTCRLRRNADSRPSWTG